MPQMKTIRENVRTAIILEILEPGSVIQNRKYVEPKGEIENRIKGRMLSYKKLFDNYWSIKHDASIFYADDWSYDDQKKLSKSYLESGLKKYNIRNIDVGTNEKRESNLGTNNDHQSNSKKKTSNRLAYVITTAGALLLIFMIFGKSEDENVAAGSPSSERAAAYVDTRVSPYEARAACESEALSQMESVVDSCDTPECAARTGRQMIRNCAARYGY
jgi:hypothetical protein